MVAVVRRIGPDDWADWRRIRLRCLAESPEAFPGQIRRWSDDHDTEQRWRDRIAGSDCFLAEVDGAVVGLVSAESEPDGRVQLMSMFVAEQARGTGTGRALIDAVVERAADCPLYLRVIQGNQQAIGVYERVGFRHDGAAAAADDCVTMHHVPTSEESSHAR